VAVSIDTAPSPRGQEVALVAGEFFDNGIAREKIETHGKAMGFSLAHFEVESLILAQNERWRRA
jgi:hypothetical protein